MRKIVALLLFLICAWGGVSANENKGGGTLTEHTIKHKGVEYTYYLYTPKSLPKGAPLVMVFHGYDGRNLPTLGYGFNSAAEIWKFFSLYIK